MDATAEQLDELILFEVVDQVAWITINNPDKANAISPQTVSYTHLRAHET